MTIEDFITRTQAAIERKLPGQVVTWKPGVFQGREGVMLVLNGRDVPYFTRTTDAAWHRNRCNDLSLRSINCSSVLANVADNPWTLRATDDGRIEVLDINDLCWKPV